MESFNGLTGTITCPTAMGVTIKSVQSDVSDPTVTDVNVSISGSLGTEYTVSAVSPIVTDLIFKVDETITVAASGTLNMCSINYVYRGDEPTYMTQDPNRAYNTKNLPGKWDV